MNSTAIQFCSKYYHFSTSLCAVLQGVWSDCPSGRHAVHRPGHLSRHCKYKTVVSHAFVNVSSAVMFTSVVCFLLLTSQESILVIS